MSDARTMSAAEVAAEFGRSLDWLYEHRARLEREKRLPPPLHGDGPLTWSRAQVYACLDRDLPASTRALAAAIRAAEAAFAAGGDTTDEDIETARRRLDNRFHKEPA